MASDRALLILIVTVAILFVTALLFGCGVLVLRRRNDRMAERWHALEDRWQVLLLDVLSGETPPALLFARVEPADETRFVEFLARFSQRLRGAEQEILMQLARPLWPRVDRMLRSRRPETRAHAVQLASMLAEDADTQIAPALNDRSPLVNMVAARALARRRSTGYLPLILKRSTRFGEWDPRYMATMLAGVGAAAADNLRATLADATAPSYARMVAADALKRMQDLPSAETAVAVLSGNADAEVTRACIRLLAVVGQQQHTRLLDRFVAAPDETVRGAAVSALGRLGTAADLPLLERTLQDDSRWVILRAVKAIRQLGGPESLREAGRRLSAGSPVAAEIRGTAP